MWLTEGGQSAVGSLIDRIIFKYSLLNFCLILINNIILFSHSSIQQYKKETQEKGFSNIFDYLNWKVQTLANEKSLPHQAFLTQNVHVLPYFHELIPL